MPGTPCATLVVRHPSTKGACDTHPEGQVLVQAAPSHQPREVRVQEQGLAVGGVGVGVGVQGARVRRVVVRLGVGRASGWSNQQQWCAAQHTADTATTKATGASPAQGLFAQLGPWVP